MEVVLSIAFLLTALGLILVLTSLFFTVGFIFFIPLILPIPLVMKLVRRRRTAKTVKLR